MKIRFKLCAVAAATGLLLSTAPAANAAPAAAQAHPASVATTAVAPARGSVTYWRYEVINLKKTKDWTNKAEELGTCKVSKGTGGYCKISNGSTVGTDVNVSLGAPIGDIAATVGFNYHYSTNVNVEWSSLKIPKNKSALYKAYAVGTRATYKIQKWKGTKAMGQKKTTWTLQSTSGTLQAFSPSPRGGFDIVGSTK